MFISKNKTDHKKSHIDIRQDIIDNSIYYLYVDIFVISFTIKKEMNLATLKFEKSTDRTKRVAEKFQQVYN